MTTSPPHRRTPRRRPLPVGQVVLVGALAFGLFAGAAALGSRAPEAKAAAPTAAGATDTTIAGQDSTAAPTDPASVTTAAGDTTEASATTTSATEPKQPGVPRVYLAGDSTAGGLGSGLGPLLDQMGVEQKLDYKNSSGLTRPDFYDWPKR